MSAVTNLRRSCNVCGSLGKSRHKYAGWTGLTLCSGCVKKIDAQVELMINRTHSEVLGKFGLKTARSDWDRDRWVSILEQDSINSVIKGLHSYFPHGKIVMKIPLQRTLPGIRWRDASGRFTRFEDAPSRDLV
jgi:hypothetical protein